MYNGDSGTPLENGSVALTNPPKGLTPRKFSNSCTQNPRYTCVWGFKIIAILCAAQFCPEFIAIEQMHCFGIIMGRGRNGPILIKAKRDQKFQGQRKRICKVVAF